MIAFTDLTFAHEKKHPVLRGATGHVAPGSLAILAGPNGAGKSTLLGLLAGILTPDAGDVRVGELRSPGHEDRIRRAVRLVLQDPDMQILGATVSEDLMLAGDPRDPRFLAVARDAAARLDLERLWDAPVHTLSFGQRRKLCLAAALVHPPDEPPPRILLLDEPLSNLDYPAVLEMRRILRANTAAGLTQIMAAHELDPLADLADHVLVLHHGRIVLEGPPADVLPRVRPYGVRPPYARWEGEEEMDGEEGNGREEEEEIGGGEPLF
ncbi:energy-coupling factor ABC transporter ATP-binding protein [Desulfolutivibrio sulfoxidireducens]|uniref:energy-coupling factor ABC transporter ATP-binding protein n=1 Tax=Desulfolutivibrio sulfoxidireducens TaxID=2773299 RepID=UPI00159E5F4C|nr:ABC transporter ATP-binding protein [Desulfolutivibrio sulfoxidireducens]QLA15542.1 ATP-binding cassette domain-containing protein [Desulfolutivibrio sulfoxidireducens]